MGREELASRPVPENEQARLKELFRGMMKALFHEDGASLRVEILEDPAVTGFIDGHAAILDSSFAKVEMSDIMRTRLQESDWIFSGMKAFHELNEAFPSLLDENGIRKPFEQFLRDVQSIDETYNGNWLRAEYYFAGASAEMAARWEDFLEDEDEYYLQYRTAGDDLVRPEHAALHGVTLPMKDSFWNTYYPPNGWNCRCTVVQVLKDKYRATDHAEAMRRGGEALAKDKKGMFAFNPGKQGKTFPDYNPYTISKCRICTRKLNLAKGIPENQLCTACGIVGNKAAGDITRVLKSLQDKKGAEYINTLREIVTMKIFKPVKDSDNIFSALGKSNPDYDNIKHAVEKLVPKGYKAFILPNPKETKSGDCILQKGKFIGLYEVKTIIGKNSIGNRFESSVGQAHRVILNITSQYDPKAMAFEIRRHFENNKDALEVKVLKGSKEISVIKQDVKRDFDKNFIKRYKK